MSSIVCLVMRIKTSSKHEQYTWSLLRRGLLSLCMLLRKHENDCVIINILLPQEVNLNGGLNMEEKLLNVKNVQYPCLFFQFLDSKAHYLQNCIEQYMAKYCVCNNKAQCLNTLRVWPDLWTAKMFVRVS